MINGLVGSPGSGKSYEAVVYHVLPALRDGRKVKTNLPLNIQEFEARVPGCSRLVHILEPMPGNTRRFSQLSDYLDEWRHDETNQGPLIVIDEAHNIFRGKVSPELLEYYALHRHHGVDILLITQTWRQVHAEIRDMVQICYRVRKATALGSSKTYIRKVQDGVRGEVTNQDIRKYDKANYPLYKSHTQTNKAVLEAAAKDVKPIWKHWSVQGFVLIFLFSVFAASKGWFNPFPKPPSKKPVSVQSSPVSAPVANPVVPVPSTADSPPVQAPLPSPPPPKPKPIEPYAAHGLHINGTRTLNGRITYYLLVSQAGQVVAKLQDKDLSDSGYVVTPRGRCVLELEYEGLKRFAVCDSPRVSIGSVALAR